MSASHLGLEMSHQVLVECFKAGQMHSKVTYVKMSPSCDFIFLLL